MSKLSANIKEALNIKTGLNIIVTVGNNLRYDDGAGPYLFYKLSQNKYFSITDNRILSLKTPKKDKELKIINAGYNPEDIIDDIDKLRPKKVIIIDAADFSKKPGDLKVIDNDSIPETSLSTHMVSLKVISKIIHEDTKAEIKFIGIQPKSVALGEGLSDNVVSACEKIIDYIEKEILKCMN